MDQYQIEIQSIRRKLNQLRADEADPAIVEEYDCEWRNLTALYEAAQHAFHVGAAEPEVAEALRELGFGEWTLDNVYSFVYDAALDADLEGEELARVVQETDYAESLRLALRPSPHP